MPPSYANFNVKEGQNVSCWLCEHFQRYDSAGQPTACEGECRKNPPQEARDTWDLTGGFPGSAEQIITGYCTYIFFGNTSWCNGFQVSLEDNIPDAPANQAACDHQNYDVAAWPQVFNTTGPAPFSKKPVLDSCWYCNHFQRRFEDPIAEQGQCAGYCQIKPPERFYDQNNVAPPMPPGEVVDNFVYPLVPTAAFMWCSRWERNPDAADLPDPPDAGTGACNNLPPPP